MSICITVEQLEQMKTHELADLLANVVLLLRRLPDVECKQLQQLPETVSPMGTRQSLRPSLTPLSKEELTRKNKDELKALAKDLHIPFTAKTLKDELIHKILARWATGHSEQYAIQDV